MSSDPEALTEHPSVKPKNAGFELSKQESRALIARAARLRVLEGKGHSEIADEIGMSRDAYYALRLRYSKEFSAAIKKYADWSEANHLDAILRVRTQMAEKVDKSLGVYDKILDAEQIHKDDEPGLRLQQKTAESVFNRVAPIVSKTQVTTVNISEQSLLSAAGPKRQFDLEAAGVELLSEGEDDEPIPSDAG